MDSFPRLFPYLRPYRRQLFLSILLGLVIASLWGANLTLAFPVVKVLLERQNLHDFVAEKIEDESAEEARLLTSLENLNSRLVDYRSHQVAPTDANYIGTLHSQAEQQGKLADTQSSLYRYRWLQAYVMPIVPHNEFQTLAWLLVVVLLATAIKGALIFWQDVLVGSVAESAVMGVRKDLLRHTLDLDYASLSHEGPSGLMSRFTYDAEQLSTGITLVASRLIREPLKCLSCMFLALYINWRLTLLSLLLMPLLALFLGWFGKAMKRASRRMMESMSQIYKVLEETFDGLKVVIAYNNAGHHRDHFDREYKAYFKKAMKVVKVDASAKPLLELFGLTAMFLALIPGAYLVLRMKTHIWGVRLAVDPLSPSDLTALYAVLVGMLDPIRKMNSGFSRLKRSSAAIDRIFQLMDQPSAIGDPEKPQSLPNHSKSIEFRDVSFRYPAVDPKKQRGLVLEHVDLTILFGEVVAIVGQNGSGKSTLVNLLPRFYDPEIGEVLIDGQPIRKVTLADLRRQVGIVTQETVLFDDTILENIRYGTPDATRDQVIEAARQAHVLPIIEAMPHGFDTVIGNKGRDLSGGQRQRIALARVILKNPSILILDEATSAADANSESLIHETLKTFVKDRTTFLISHTLSQSLLEFVTKVILMENGKVVMVGTHEELLKASPLYRRLFQAPSRQMSQVAETKAA
ncbi:MAG: ABC transporter ATP-binding protein [Planctomycetaceae bacterium]|nr:ABC transporter ATP-binding protein [Planctomycetaceae bacterium]